MFFITVIAKCSCFKNMKALYEKFKVKLSIKLTASAVKTSILKSVLMTTFENQLISFKT